LVFYAVWDPPYVLLLIASFCFNYYVGWRITHLSWPKAELAGGVVVNLAVLGFYKYSGQGFVLPLGISFFTFTQIGYLVDCLDKRWRDLSFLDFVFFVTFFPHLIAGPIIHVRDIIPNISKMGLTAERFSYGMAYFILGLSKKVLVADWIAPGDTAVGAIPAWTDLARFALQLYFDFSGYSDMAIGLAAMVGVKFPLNFNSPYKATNIIDFWQRWHMTLTRYLRLLLFNPLAMAFARRGYGGFWLLIPLVVTMAIAGAWHGAGWAFLVWGLVQAGLLIINHVWRLWRLAMPAIGGLVLTQVAWVASLALFHGVPLPPLIGAQGLGQVDALALAAVVGGYIIAVAAPNTQELMKDFNLDKGILPLAPLTVLALLDIVVMNSATPKPFLYFQF
jgi:alginate O-acetyltransferase complex protein AlgI